MDKYQDWSKVLIEPATMNDARLFSLESRMHEEEEIRIKEYEFVRDLLKKLIYSLEKTNVSALDGVLGSQSLQGNKSTDIFGGGPSASPIQKTSQSKSQTPMLPNLLNNISLQNSIRDITQLGKNGNSINDSLISVGKPG